MSWPKARKFAKLYNLAQLKRICSLGKKQGRPLTKSHVCRLVVIRKRRLRDQVARECATCAWTVLRLEDEIQRIQPKRAYGGRLLYRPVTMAEALFTTERLASKWIRWVGVLTSADGVEVESTERLPASIRRRQIAIAAEMKKLQRQIRRRLNQRT